MDFLEFLAFLLFAACCPNQFSAGTLFLPFAGSKLLTLSVTYSLKFTNSVFDLRQRKFHPMGTFALSRWVPKNFSMLIPEKLFRLLSLSGRKGYLGNRPFMLDPLNP